MGGAGGIESGKYWRGEITFGRALSVGILFTLISTLKVILDNPLLNAAVTFTEPFPVGLLITLISAAILQKKRTTGDGLADESGYGTAQARTSDAN